MPRNSIFDLSQHHVISYLNLKEDILGLNVMLQGRLRLANWDGMSKLPLAALDDDVIAYILSHSGGGSLPYTNYDVTQAAGLSSTTEAVVITVTAPADYKLAGIIVSGQNDAIVRVKIGGTLFLLTYLSEVQRTFAVNFPVAKSVSAGTVVDITIEMDDATASDFNGTILGYTEP